MHLQFVSGFSPAVGCLGQENLGAYCDNEIYQYDSAAAEYFESTRVAIGH
jgi:hypothetical protein